MVRACVLGCLQLFSFFAAVGGIAVGFLAFAPVLATEKRRMTYHMLNRAFRVAHVVCQYIINIVGREDEALSRLRSFQFYFAGC